MNVLESCQLSGMFTDPDDGKLRRAVSRLHVLDLQVLPYDKDEAVLALSSHSAVASCRDATRKLRYRQHRALAEHAPVSTANMKHEKFEQPPQELPASFVAPVKTEKMQRQGS